MMHPRVAAQEGRFLILGRERDLLDQKIRLFPDLGGLAELVRWKHLHKIANYSLAPNGE